MPYKLACGIRDWSRVIELVSAQLAYASSVSSPLQLAPYASVGVGSRPIFTGLAKIPVSLKHPTPPR
jgi:hypothetical protein